LFFLQLFIEFGNLSHQPPAKPEAWKCEPLKAVGLLATSKVAALLPEQIQLFYPAVFLLLLPYVIPDGLFISTYSGNMVAPSPEVSAGKNFSACRDSSGLRV
jgi:hypothetical protein